MKRKKEMPCGQSPFCGTFVKEDSFTKDQNLFNLVFLINSQ